MKDSQLPDIQTFYQTPQSNLESKSAEYAKFKLFSSRGRIGRMRYLVYSLLQLGIGIFLVKVSLILNPDDGGMIMIIFIILWLIGILGLTGIGIILMIQRFHDTDTSGFFILFLLVPFLNIALFLWLFLAPGIDGSNRYGFPSR